MTSPWITSSFTITHAAAAQERVRLMEQNIFHKNNPLLLSELFYVSFPSKHLHLPFDSDCWAWQVVVPRRGRGSVTRWTCGYCEASVLLSAQGNGSIRLQLLSVQHWPGQLLPSQPTTLITRTLSPPHWGDLDVQIDT